MIAWSLSVATVIFILLLVSFVGLLLAGNGLIRQGVAEGGGAVSRILPEVAGVRDRATQEVEEKVLLRYHSLLEQLYHMIQYVL